MTIENFGERRVNIKKLIKGAGSAFMLISCACHASIAHFHSEGDFVQGGGSIDYFYSSADPTLLWNWVELFDDVTAAGDPYTYFIRFTFLKNPFLVSDLQFASISFRSIQGTPLTRGTYVDAERAPFASPGHPGLDILYGGLGCNRLTGGFTIHQISFDAGLLDQFSASYNQTCEGGGSIWGTFAYDAKLTEFPAPVPEPTTLALLGIGAVAAVSVRRRKVAIGSTGTCISHSL